VESRVQVLLEAEDNNFPSPKKVWLTQIDTFPEIEGELWNSLYSKRMPQTPSKYTTGSLKQFD
jgi:hypothetical protein